MPARLFPMVVLLVLDRALSWMKNFSRLRLVDSASFGSGPSLDVKRRQRPFPILDDHVGPIEANLVRWSRQIMQTFFGCHVIFSMAFSDVSCCLLWFCVVGGRGLRDVCTWGWCPESGQCETCRCRQFLFRFRAPRVRKPTSGIENARG